MKHSEIKAGSIYAGKAGTDLRKVVGVYRRPFVFVTYVLAGLSRSQPRRTITMSAFARWAKERVG